MSNGKDMLIYLIGFMEKIFWNKYIKNESIFS